MRQNFASCCNVLVYEFTARLEVAFDGLICFIFHVQVQVIKSFRRFFEAMKHDVQIRGSVDDTRDALFLQ